MIARLLFLATIPAVWAVNTDGKSPPPSILPERLPETRYEKLRSNAPFALATAEEKKEEVIPWAQNLYVGSVAKWKLDGVEKDWVVIKDRTQPGTLIQLFGNDINSEGYQLVKLEWSDEPKRTKASVKKGTEFATLEFDQAAFAASSAPMPMQSGAQKNQPTVVPRPGMPPGVPVPAGSNLIRPPSATGTINRPTVPGAPTTIRPPVTIPRPTNLPPAFNQPGLPQNPAMAPGTNTRQRIRVIPSGNPNQ